MDCDRVNGSGNHLDVNNGCQTDIDYQGNDHDGNFNIHENNDTNESDDLHNDNNNDGNETNSTPANENVYTNENDTHLNNDNNNDDNEMNLAFANENNDTCECDTPLNYDLHNDNNNDDNEMNLAFANDNQPGNNEFDDCLYETPNNEDGNMNFKSNNKGWKNKNKNYNKNNGSNNNNNNKNNENNSNNNNNNNNNNNKKNENNSNGNNKNENNNNKKNENNSNGNNKNENNNNNSKSNNNFYSNIGSAKNTTVFFPNNEKGYSSNFVKANDPHITNFITATNMTKNVFIMKILKTVLDVLGINKEPKGPYDSFVLRLHYRFGLAFFLLAFFLVWHNIYTREQIFCIGVGGAEKPLPSYIINICLSYSKQNSQEGGNTRTLLFYRFVHFSCLVVCGCFLLLKIFVRRCGTARMRNLFSYLTKNATKIDPAGQEQSRKAIMHYLKENSGSLTTFYCTYVFNHVLAAGITLSCFFFLDFVLQGEFVNLPFLTFPLVKDPETFGDPLSLVFPPFATCVISEDMSKMFNLREEEINCHLTLMELYEKLFIITWFYLVLLLVIGMVNVCLLICLPLFKSFILWTQRRRFSLEQAKIFLINKVSFGDLFLLYFLKSYISEKQFGLILTELHEYVKQKQKVKVV